VTVIVGIGDLLWMFNLYDVSIGRARDELGYSLDVASMIGIYSRSLLWNLEQPGDEDRSRLHIAYSNWTGDESPHREKTSEDEMNANAAATDYSDLFDAMFAADALKTDAERAAEKAEAEAESAAIRAEQDRQIADRNRRYEAANKPCPKCNGAGYLAQYGHIAHGTCFKCGGAGIIRR
jgi:hypothetical protein